MPYTHIRKSILVTIAAAELAALLSAAVSLAAGKRLLAEKTKRAKREKTRNALLSSAAHKTRELVFAIRMSSGLLLDSDKELSPREHEDILKLIRESADRLTPTVEDIITLTDSSMAEQRPKMQSVSAEEIVSECANDFRRRYNGIGVTTYVPGDMPEIMMDAQLIKRVIQNLLESLAEYVGDGRIDITVKAAGGFAEFGFNAEGKPEANDIGEPFGQSGGEEKDIRIPTCKAIVGLHGGKIRGGKTGSGAEFVFTLPLQ